MISASEGVIRTTDLFSKQTLPFDLTIGEGDISNTSVIRSLKLYLTYDVKTASSNTNEQFS